MSNTPGAAPAEVGFILVKVAFSQGDKVWLVEKDTILEDRVWLVEKDTIQEDKEFLVEKDIILEARGLSVEKGTIHHSPHPGS